MMKHDEPIDSIGTSTKPRATRSNIKQPDIV